jgi:hypothetical protein
MDLCIPQSSGSLDAGDCQRLVAMINCRCARTQSPFLRGDPILSSHPEGAVSTASKRRYGEFSQRWPPPSSRRSSP